MSNRGGFRPGSGRKNGSLTRKSVEIAERAVAEGMSPLELILEDMHFWHEEAQKLRPLIIDQLAKLKDDGFDPEVAKKIREMSAIHDKALSAAITAAPFCHTRLGALAVFEPVNTTPLMQLTK